jgi:hypothetical protein
MRCVYLKSHLRDRTFKFDAEVKYQYISKDLDYLVGIIHHERVFRDSCCIIIKYNISDGFRDELYNEINNVLGPLQDHELYFLIGQKYESDEMLSGRHIKPATQWCLGVCGINDLHLKPSVKERRAFRDIRGYYILDDERFICYKLNEPDNIIYSRQEIGLGPSKTYDVPKSDSIDLLSDLIDIEIISLYKMDACHRSRGGYYSLIDRSRIGNLNYHSLMRVKGIQDVVLCYDVIMRNNSWKRQSACFNKVNLDKYIYKSDECSSIAKNNSTLERLDASSMIEEIFLPYIIPRLGSKFNIHAYYGFKELFRA